MVRHTSGLKRAPAGGRDEQRRGPASGCLAEQAASGEYPGSRRKRWRSPIGRRESLSNSSAGFFSLPLLTYPPTPLVLYGRVQRVASGKDSVSGRFWCVLETDRIRRIARLPVARGLVPFKLHGRRPINSRGGPHQHLMGGPINISGGWASMSRGVGHRHLMGGPINMLGARGTTILGCPINGGRAGPAGRWSLPGVVVTRRTTMYQRGRVGPRVTTPRARGHSD